MKKYYIGMLAILVIGLSLWKFADATGANTFNGCAKSADGSVYLIGNSYPYSVCQGIDKAITWMKRGPIGPAGPVGPMGPQGPAGANGTGSSLHFYDGNNQLLGQVITDSNKVYLNNNLFFNFNQSGYSSGTGIGVQSTYSINISENNNLYFDSNDCTVDATHFAYTATVPNLGVVYFGPNSTGYTLNQSNSSYQNTQTNSRFVLAPGQGGNGQCTVNTGPESTWPKVKLDQVTLPFTLPIQGPIQIQ